MVEQSHIVYANLLKGQDRVSIGTVSEIAWAYHLKRHTVITINKENVHNHAFVLEMADIVFETHDESLGYLEKLAKMEF